MPPPSHSGGPSGSGSLGLLPLPTPPEVPRLLNDLLSLHPADLSTNVLHPLRPDQYPPIASLAELENLKRAVGMCRDAARDRNLSARAALAFMGQPLVGDGGGQSSGSTSVVGKGGAGTSGGDKKNAHGLTLERHGSVMSDGTKSRKNTASGSGLGLDTSRSTPGIGAFGEGSNSGSTTITRTRNASKTNTTCRGSHSPTRVKREISASPIPDIASANDSSLSISLASGSHRRNGRSPSLFSADGFDPGSIPLSQSGGPKKKKRKLVHDESQTQSLDGRSAKLGSPTASARSSTPAGGSTSAAAAGTAGGIPKERPGLGHQASSSLKIKFKLGETTKPLTLTPPPRPEPTYHHPYINFNLPQQQSFALTPDAFIPPPKPAQDLPLAATGLASPPPLTTASLPLSSLIPPRQPIPPPPKPGPKRQKDVDQDFTQVKHVTQQVTWNTFWSGVEPYLREIGPEDLALLRFKPDNETPYVIPPLGRHYQDVWDEDDNVTSFGSVAGVANGMSSSAAAAQSARESRMAGRNRKYIVPRDMNDEDLFDDQRGLGVLTERIAGAFLPDDLLIKIEAEERKKERKKEEQAGAHGVESGLPAGTGPGDIDLGKEVEGRPVGQISLDAKEDEDEPMRGRSPHRSPLVKASQSDDIIKKESDGQDEDVDWDRGGEKTTSSNELDDLVDFRWPIAPHRIPSPARKPGERDRADVMGVDIGELEEGVKREMRLLQLIGPDDQVRLHAVFCSVIEGQNPNLS